MILRLHTEYQGGMYKATNIFHVNGDINSDKFPNLLARIQTYVNNPYNHSIMCQYGYAIPFEVTEHEHKYEFKIIDNMYKKHTIEEVENAICSITGKSAEEIMTNRTRGAVLYVPRMLLVASLRYFAGMPLNAIQRRYNYDRANIINATNKSLPSFIVSGDPHVVDWVYQICDYFQNIAFFDVCKTGRFASVNYNRQ